MKTDTRGCSVELLLIPAPKLLVKLSLLIRINPDIFWTTISLKITIQEYHELKSNRKINQSITHPRIK